MISGLGIPDEDALNIYTDGSSFPHRRRAAGVGIRFVWINEEGNEEIEDYAPAGWQSSTSDEMELMACIVALKETRKLFNDMRRFKRVLIFSDSMYVTGSFSNTGTRSFSTPESWEDAILILESMDS